MGGWGGRHVSLQFATQQTGLSMRFIFEPYREELGLHFGTSCVEKNASIPLVGTQDVFYISSVIDNKGNRDVTSDVDKRLPGYSSLGDSTNL